MSTVEAVIAANRFGLGARPGELALAEADPRGWLAGQISIAPALPAELNGLPASADVIRDIHEARLQGPKKLEKKARQGFRKVLFEEIVARTRAHINTAQPFAERMVLFWANHFTVSASKFIVAPTIGGFEREAIRPHIFGRFENLLLAVVRHPAMLEYLDNTISFGPNSLAGQSTRRGLNENLAREILELHTLGVDGGYTQNDVTEFARMLTGWTHGGIHNRKSVERFGPLHGRFQYREILHEPGAKTLLGKRYPEAGEQEGIEALKDLVRHPATARFIATKLARHFIADEPPAAAVDALAESFRESDGHLGAVSRTLIGVEAAWREPLAKFKTPYELTVSTLRAAAFDDIRRREFVGTYRQLGQTPFAAPSPAGWPDRAKDWISPEALLRRVEWLRAAVARFPRSLDPQAVAEQTVGPLLSDRTAEMITAAPSGEEALAMLFASPEFQKR